MKYAFLVLSLAFVTGCGAFTNKDVASDVIVDDGRAVEHSDEQFILDNIINGTDDKVIVGDTEVIIVEDDAAVQQDRDIVGSLDASQNAPTPTPGTITPATGRTSPVTGPSIPESEMREILNAQLVANGEAPRY